MAGTSDTSSNVIEDYRWSQFMGMGFSDHDALVLALTKGDNGWPLSVHKVRKAISSGCSIELALRIFGPLENEQVVVEEIPEDHLA